MRRQVYWIILLGIALLGFLALVIDAIMNSKLVSHSESEPYVIPNAPPFHSYIAAIGMVEASSDNISIGSPLNRIVRQVFAKEGEKIKKGEILFELDQGALYADQQQKTFALKKAEEQLKRLLAKPRQEDIPPLEAAVKIAQASFDDAKNQMDSVNNLTNKNAISREEYNRRSHNLALTEAKLTQAQSELDKVKAGTWKPDIVIAELDVKIAKAELDKAQRDLNETVVRSPIDGVILRVNIKPGEFAQNEPNKSLIVIGNITKLYLRVDINEYDAWQFHKQSPAQAYLPGNSEIHFPLEFVRMTPYVVPKKNQSINPSELIDIRVLQVIYQFDPGNHNVFVGQQLDVYIEAQRVKSL